MVNYGKHIKPKVAFFDFTSCEGCQLTVIDSLQTSPELLDMIEIVEFREAMSERSDDYQIAFVEGSCTRSADEERLKKIRENATLVIALGSCAHLGGINAIKNMHPLADVRSDVYGDKAEWYDTYATRPISAVIDIDGLIPGCPIDRDEFLRVVKMLLQGRQPIIPDHPLCIECKLKENVCMYLRGKICLGPIVRAGCGAICPTFGDGCEGCRGLITNPNIESMKMVLEEHGLNFKEVEQKLSMFMAYQTEEIRAEIEGANA